MHDGARLATLLAVLTLLVSFLSLAGTASAHTYTHGLNVWSDGVTLSEDDEVKGDVNVIFGTLACDGSATIDGNVTVFFGNFDPLGECDVRGTTSRVFGSSALEAFAPWAASDTLFHPNRALMRKLGWDLVVVIAFLLFPFRMRVALDRVEKHPGSSTAVGAIALVAMIPVAVLLLVSIIGIPLIPIEIAAVFAGLWIGQGAVALLLGRRLFELMRPATTPAPLGALVVGLVLITAAETLPIVGWAVTAIVALTGLGSAILAFVRETAFHSFRPGPRMVGQDINRPA
jgi:hypothetical protein